MDDRALQAMIAVHRVLIVVVLYKVLPCDSATVLGLAAAFRQNDRLRASYEVLLWDNTPLGVEIEASDGPSVPDSGFGYRRATVNDGVSGAVNLALELRASEGYEWLLLLDQDTTVTGEYLDGMLRHLPGVHGSIEIGAIVPVLYDQRFQLSPKQVLRFRDATIAPTVPGLLQGEVFAANSGVMLRVSALQVIGGYSRDFWLDHSDIYVFHQLYLHKRRVYFASDLALQHSMTMIDYDGSMSPARYENFLHAEQAFFDLYKGALENSVQALRLFMRVFRQRRRYSNKSFSRMTLRFLLRRLGTSRSSRLTEWKLRAARREQPDNRENGRYE